MKKKNQQLHLDALYREGALGQRRRSKHCPSLLKNVLLLGVSSWWLCLIYLLSSEVQKIYQEN